MTGILFDLDVHRNAIHVLGVTLIQWWFPCLDGRSQAIGHAMTTVAASGAGKSDRLRALLTSWPLLANSGSPSGDGRSSAVAPTKREALLSRATLGDAGQP